MKKTYITPEIEEFVVDTTTTILAGSDPSEYVENPNGSTSEGWADSPELFDDGSVDW